MKVSKAFGDPDYKATRNTSKKPSMLNKDKPIVVSPKEDIYGRTVNQTVKKVKRNAR